MSAGLEPADSVIQSNVFCLPGDALYPLLLVIIPHDIRDGCQDCSPGDNDADGDEPAAACLFHIVHIQFLDAIQFHMGIHILSSMPCGHVLCHAESFPAPCTCIYAGKERREG